MENGFEADGGDAGRRLIAACMDRWPLVPEAVLRRGIAEGALTVNGQPASTRYVLRSGDRVTGPEWAWQGEIDEPLPDVLYADEDVLVVNKPAGCTVVRERREPTCAFADGLLRWLREKGAEGYRLRRFRPHAVHRLDRDTTGAVVVVLTPEAKRGLCAQFRGRSVEKEYLALVRGAPAEPEGEIDAPIEAHPADDTRMQIARRGGKPSRTLYRVEETFRGHALLRCRPVTGRRHQVRVHLAHVGLPVLGDATYGGGRGIFLSDLKRGYKPKEGRAEAPLISRTALHAAVIAFTVPSGRRVRVEAPVPKDLERALKALRRWGRAGRGA